MADIDIDTMTDHYIIAALWSSVDDDGNPLDGIDATLSDAMQAQARIDCAAFLTDIGPLLKSYPGNAEQIGHDFWLTRNGHGVGFWDRGLGDLGDRLTAAANAYGGVDLYISDAGQIEMD